MRIFKKICFTKAAKKARITDGYLYKTYESEAFEAIHSWAQALLDMGNWCETAK